jgi:hypothetical protein
MHLLLHKEWSAHKPYVTLESLKLLVWMNFSLYRGRAEQCGGLEPNKTMSKISSKPSANELKCNAVRFLKSEQTEKKQLLPSSFKTLVPVKVHPRLRDDQTTIRGDAVKRLKRRRYE